MKTYVIEQSHVGNDAEVSFRCIAELPDDSRFNDVGLIEEIVYASNGRSYELPEPECWEIDNLSPASKKLLQDVADITFWDESFFEEYESALDDDDYYEDEE